MFYCLACTNQLLVFEDLLESEINTEDLICSNCHKKLKCVISVKPSAVGKIDMQAHDRFIKISSIELIERWNDEDFQREKEIFIQAFTKQQFFWRE